MIWIGCSAIKEATHCTAALPRMMRRVSFLPGSAGADLRPVSFLPGRKTAVNCSHGDVHRGRAYRLHARTRVVRRESLARRRSRPSTRVVRRELLERRRSRPRSAPQPASRRRTRSRSLYGMCHGSERRLLGRLLEPATMNKREKHKFVLVCIRVLPMCQTRKLLVLVPEPRCP